MEKDEFFCQIAIQNLIQNTSLDSGNYFILKKCQNEEYQIGTLQFHDFFSGSGDTNLKLWDIRRKGCIFTYKGHSETVTCLKFSPDGQWVASGGEEGAVKVSI